MSRTSTICPCDKVQIAVILNVEADHLDFFKDIDDIQNSFRKFVLTLPQNEKGFLILNGDIRDREFFTEGIGCAYTTFGLGEGCDYTAADIQMDEGFLKNVSAEGFCDIQKSVDAGCFLKMISEKERDIYGRTDYDCTGCN